MPRLHLLAALLLAGAAPGSDCSFSTGPNGVCAAVRLEPDRTELRSGTTVQIAVNGLECSGTMECVDCNGRRRRFRWRSSAPEVAAVNAAGLLEARGAGTAEITLEPESGASPVPSVRVLVAP